MKFPRRFAVLLLKISLLTLAMFVAVEVVLLIFNDTFFHASFYVFDRDMGFRVRPYARYGNDRANEFGFNDRDYPHTRTPGTYRILFLGDSFNWMGGQETNYTAILERQFEEDFGPGRVEVISAGYSQTHTGEQLVALEKFGLQYHPDLVVLGFFAGNDFYDADPNRRRIVVGASLTDVFPDRDFYHVVLGQPLVFRSRLLLYAEELWSVYWTNREHAQRIRRETRDEDSGPPILGLPDGTPQARKAGLTDEYLTSIRLRTQFFDPKHFREYAPHVQYIFDSLSRMRSLLAARGIRFLVAVYPDQAQVDPGVRAEFVRRLGLDARDWQWDRPQQLLERFCADHGIEFFDLAPIFADHCRRGEDLYIQSDTHWNTAGNRLAAAILQTYLDGRVRQRIPANPPANSGRSAARDQAAVQPPSMVMTDPWVKAASPEAR